MAAVKSTNTTPELTVRRLIHSLGFRYRLHIRALPGAPDLVFPSLRKIVFVHGCFWHRHACPNGLSMPASKLPYWKSKFERNRRRDVINRRRLRRLGWKVLVVWECQTSPLKIGKLADRITKFLRE